MKRLIERIGGISLLVYPNLAFGAVTPPRNFKGFVDIVLGIVDILVLIIFAFTFLAVIWGVAKGWIIHGGDAEGVESGKKVVFVGVVALVVMSSIWGILFLLRTTLFGS